MFKDRAPTPPRFIGHNTGCPGSARGRTVWGLVVRDALDEAGPYRAHALARRPAVWTEPPTARGTDGGTDADHAGSTLAHCLQFLINACVGPLRPLNLPAKQQHAPKRALSETGMRISRRSFGTGLAAAALLPAVRSARAQGSWPGNQTIKLVVPYPAGGATDVIGRIVADRLTAHVAHHRHRGEYRGRGRQHRNGPGRQGADRRHDIADGAAADRDQPVPLRQARVRSREGPDPDRAGREPAEHSGGEEAARRGQFGRRT